MKIVIAPDSFKGSNSSMAVATRVEKGILRVFPEAEIVKIPLPTAERALVEALVAGAGGTVYTAKVTGPMGEPARPSTPS
jgi:glycerate kinase